MAIKIFFEFHAENSLSIVMLYFYLISVRHFLKHHCTIPRGDLLYTNNISSNTNVKKKNVHHAWVQCPKKYNFPKFITALNFNSANSNVG